MNVYTKGESKMNYIKQLNEFYSTLDYKPLSAEAIAVYCLLLQIANKTGWIEEFKVANSILMSKCNISIDVLKTARNKLKTQGYINYTKGKNQNDAPKYGIIKLYTTQADTQASTLAEPQAETQTPPHISKQNNTKHKKKNIEKKFIPPTLQEVEKYVQKKELNVNATYFHDYYSAGNWIDSNGNPVKNWKQKIITWSNRNKSQKKTEKQTENRENFIELDTSNMTKEEYMKMVKGEKNV